jgi:hypothetical protein
MVQSLWDQGRGQLWSKIKERMRPPDLRPLWIEHHQTVLDAIVARDSNAARRAMDLHLRRAERELESACVIIAEGNAKDAPDDRSTRHRLSRHPVNRTVGVHKNSKN